MACSQLSYECGVWPGELSQSFKSSLWVVGVENAGGHGWLDVLRYGSGLFVGLDQEVESAEAGWKVCVCAEGGGGLGDLVYLIVAVHCAAFCTPDKCDVGGGSV